MAEDKDPTLVKLGQYQRQSENLRTQYDARWQRNMNLSKGRPVEDKKTVSEVRGRSKMYFRKIWATEWRLLASMHAAFMRDPEPYLIGGRDTKLDPAKARLLHYMVKYRADKMNCDGSLFIQHLWGLQNILNLGAGVGKLTWKYNPEQEEDGPDYMIYPNEQVYPDFSAATPQKMRYLIFENFMTYDELKENGYENLADVAAEGTPSNQVRSARYQGSQDPLQNPGENEYPSPGRYEDERRDDFKSGIFRVWECFWKEKGKIKFCVTNRDKVFLKPVQDNPYGKYYPIILGQCLTEAHKLMGEGFPEPLEGPQESYNYNLNMRKDNIALQLNPPTIVSRYGNVDLNALTNLTARKIVLADSPEAVSFTTIPDATRSAYMEAGADDAMMREMSGVTTQLDGASQSDSATESQINLSQGNAKIELYLAIAGETYFKQFYQLLAYYIQRFETDEKIFSVATEQMVAEGFQAGFHDKVDDFDADVTINVGMAYAGREQEIRQTLLVLDRGAVYNQTQLALLQTGAVPPQGVEMFNGNQLFKDLLPKLGKKELDKYFVRIPPPPVPGAAGPTGPGGKVTPQVGAMKEQIPQNELQMGSLGGF